MIPEIGQIAVVLALSLAIFQAVLPLLGAQLNNIRLMRVARSATLGQFSFVLLAFVLLVVSFINNDFSVLYVANNSNSLLPLQYRIAAVWGAHEGSLLLWVLILAGWSLAVAVFSRSLPLVLSSRVLGVMGLISIGFLSFMLFTSNPFERLFPAALDGQDLNPLLQDPGLIIHPPMLYMGYVGFSVAFAFAVAALLGGQLDAVWARWSRPWTTIAWLFLTIGIALGSWWAYYELGWGGWWFWDPVENASFMPWLVGTGLIHSLAVTEKRGAFKRWTVLLAIFAFALSLLGTFLVRSGVLTSVHAFATDPERGAFILALFVLLIGGALLLYTWRAPQVISSGRFEGLSREGLLLVNNILLTVAAATVLLGTLYPLAYDAFGWGKLSVGPPYFDAVFLPLMLPLLIAMGFGAVARWKRDSWGAMAGRLKWAALIALVIGITLPLALFAKTTVLVGIGMIFATWVIASAFWEPLYRMRQLKRGLRSSPRHIYGMSLAHIGVGVFVIGVALTNGFSIEKDIVLQPGKSVDMDEYNFRFDGVKQHRGPNYRALRGSITISEHGKYLITLNPEKRIYTVQQSPMTEAGIDPGLFRDLYVSLGEPAGENKNDIGGAWSLRIQYKPFVRWIWLGAIFMALGGLLAATDKRYRGKKNRNAKTTGVPA